MAPRGARPSEPLGRGPAAGPGWAGFGVSLVELAPRPAFLPAYLLPAVALRAAAGKSPGAGCCWRVSVLLFLLLFFAALMNVVVPFWFCFQREML